MASRRFPGRGIQADLTGRSGTIENPASRSLLPSNRFALGPERNRDAAHQDRGGETQSSAAELSWVWFRLAAVRNVYLAWSKGRALQLILSGG